MTATPSAATMMIGNNVNDSAEKKNKNDKNDNSVEGEGSNEYNRRKIIHRIMICIVCVIVVVVVGVVVGVLQRKKNGNQKVPLKNNTSEKNSDKNDTSTTVSLDPTISPSISQPSYTTPEMPPSTNTNSNSNNNNNNDSDAPFSFPTAATPTNNPTITTATATATNYPTIDISFLDHPGYFLAQQIIALDPNLDDIKVLLGVNDPEIGHQSPQSRAIDWMVLYSIETDPNLIIQQFAILTFHFSIQPIASTTPFNLQVQSSICGWNFLDSDGIYCSNDEITRLDLLYQILPGTIPTELGYLTALTKLGLGYSQLTGMIPSQLGFMTALEILDLRFNELSGTIPTELGNLSNLTWLSLGGNMLNGTIPTQIGDLLSLSLLQLYKNDLSGTIPSEIGSLDVLGILTLFDIPELSGTIPNDGNFTNLSDLRIFGTLIDGDIDFLACRSSAVAFIANCLPSGRINCTCCSACCDFAGQNCQNNIV